MERRNGGVGRRNDFIVEKRDGNVERRNENVVSVDRGASSEPLSTRNQGKFVLSMFIKVYALTSVTRKNRQMSTKVAQNDFTRKMIDFDTFTKIS